MKWIWILILLCLIPTVSAWDDWPYCGQQSLFFRNDTSDIAGYYVLDHRPEIASEYARKVSVSSSTGPLTIGKWILPSTWQNVSVLAPGLWRFRMYHNVSSAVGVTTFEYSVFNRSPSGVETNLFYSKSITAEVDSLTPVEYLTSYARRNYTALFPGDRLLIRVNASTSSVTARDAWITVAGNSRASMVDMEYFLCPALDVEPPDVEPVSGVADTGVAFPFAFAVLGGIIVGLLLLRRKQ
jgi:hypothetical protein